MSLFHATTPSTIGVLIDIGSASVLVALVASDPRKVYPDIIWSYREYTPLRESAQALQSSKNILTSLMNATLQLDTVGRKVLKQALPRAAAPTYVQVTVAAPWAHTITKTVSYTKDEVFKITADLLAELEAAAQKNIEQDLQSNETLVEMKLQVMTKITTEVLANGYNLSVANGQNTTTVVISRTNALISEPLTAAIAEVEDKTFRSATSRHYAFMLAYFQVVKSLYPDLLEYCLVDVTYEAVEIGIVREGVLRYCSYVPCGAYTLAREISAVRKVPVAEAYGSMMSGLVTDGNESAAQTAALEELFLKFDTKIAGLFMETGDTLSIPKTVMIHSTLEGEDFFKERIKKASTMATRGTHTVLTISNELAKRYYPPETQPQLKSRHDTGVLITAQFFHTERDRKEFEW